MFATPSAAALAFLPFAIPIALWVAWSDIARMKIPNAAVLTLVAVFLVVGPFVLPLGDWGWRWMHLAVVLFIGFFANMAGLMGAGDAKFLAAAAPFVGLADAWLVLVLLTIVSIAAYVAHRALRAIPAVRRATPDWASWTNPKFPAGLALGPTLAAYLVLAALSGA